MRRAVPFLMLAAMAPGALAGVTLDGTVGAPGALAGPNYAINAGYGQQVGTNLFHSFATFSLLGGETATFNNVGAAGAIGNIISRVTGGIASSINGTIASTVPGANVYLVNPSGITFGAGAAINVPGSFYASTAHYLRLADGGRFDATTPSNSVLTAAPPAAFGFLSPPAPIALNGATLTGANGGSLSIVAGDITVSGASLSAPAGRVDLASAASAGEVQLAPGSIVSSAAGGGIALSDSSVNADSAPGLGSGAIVIRAGRLVSANTNLIAQNSEAAAGAASHIDVAGELVMSGGTVAAITLGAGAGGDLQVSAGSVALSDMASIGTATLGTGRGGAFTLTASGSVSLAGAPGAPFGTGLFANSFGAGGSGRLALTASALAMDDAVIQAFVTGSGDSGGIGIAAGRISLVNGAAIETSTSGAGQGGVLSVSATERLDIHGQGSGARPSGLFSNTTGSGNAGAVTVSTPVLSLDGGLIQSLTASAGNAGQVSASVGTASLTNGGQVDVGMRTGATGNAGNLSLGASGAVHISGGLGGGVFSGLFSDTVAGGGSGGSIMVSAGSVTVDGAQIHSLTRSAGAAGDIVITAAEINLLNGADINARSLATGRGGNVVLASASTLVDAAQVSVESTFTGNAGSLSLRATDSLRLHNGARISTQATIADGGDVDIRVGRLIHMVDSEISTAVGTGFGNGGNIFIDPEFLVLNSSNIIANAFGGNGGNITIQAGNFLRSPDSTISASSQLSQPGSISISAEVVNIGGTIETAPPRYLGAQLAASPCLPRISGRASSLVVGGRGALPFTGDEYLAARSPEPRAEALSTPRAQTDGAARLGKLACRG